MYVGIGSLYFLVWVHFLVKNIPADRFWFESIPEEWFWYESITAELFFSIIMYVGN